MNTFVSAAAYPAGGLKLVVRINFDTLYSLAWLDLTKEPVIVSSPDTNGRYFLLPILDMWTDVFASPGWRTTGTQAQNFLIIPPGWRPDLRVIEDFKLDDVDVVLLIEVLEHFSRKDALKLLTRLEKICRKGIMIFSPLGEIHREPKDQNALQRFRSSWIGEDFAKLGYDVDVYSGFYREFNPPLDAAWAVKKCGIRTTVPSAFQNPNTA